MLPEHPWCIFLIFNLVAFLPTNANNKMPAKNSKNTTFVDNDDDGPPPLTNDNSDDDENNNYSEDDDGPPPLSDDEQIDDDDLPPLSDDDGDFVAPPSKNIKVPQVKQQQDDDEIMPSLVDSDNDNDDMPALSDGDDDENFDMPNLEHDNEDPLSDNDEMPALSDEEGNEHEDYKLDQNAPFEILKRMQQFTGEKKPAANTSPSKPQVVPKKKAPVVVKKPEEPKKPRVVITKQEREARKQRELEKERAKMSNISAVPLVEKPKQLEVEAEAPIVLSKCAYGNNCTVTSKQVTNQDEWAKIHCNASCKLYFHYKCWTQYQKHAKVDNSVPCATPDCGWVIKATWLDRETKKEKETANFTAGKKAVPATPTAVPPPQPTVPAKKSLVKVAKEKPPKKKKKDTTSSETKTPLESSDQQPQVEPARQPMHVIKMSADPPQDMIEKWRLSKKTTVNARDKLIEEHENEVLQKQRERYMSSANGFAQESKSVGIVTSIKMEQMYGYILRENHESVHFEFTEIIDYPDVELQIGFLVQFDLCKVKNRKGFSAKNIELLDSVPHSATFPNDEHVLQDELENQVHELNETDFILSGSLNVI